MYCDRAYPTSPWAPYPSMDAEEVPALNPVALVALQAVLFLVLLNALFALGASTGTALLVAWLGSVPALFGVVAVAMLPRRE